MAAAKPQKCEVRFPKFSQFDNRDSSRHFHRTGDLNQLTSENCSPDAPQSTTLNRSVFFPAAGGRVTRVRRFLLLRWGRRGFTFTRGEGNQ